MNTSVWIRNTMKYLIDKKKLCLLKVVQKHSAFSFQVLILWRGDELYFDADCFSLQQYVMTLRKQIAMGNQLGADVDGSSLSQDQHDQLLELQEEIERQNRAPKRWHLVIPPLWSIAKSKLLSVYSGMFAFMPGLWSGVRWLELTGKVGDLSLSSGTLLQEGKPILKFQCVAACRYFFPWKCVEQLPKDDDGQPLAWQLFICFGEAPWMKPTDVSHCRKVWLVWPWRGNT